jgi:hypothetical protein
MDDIDSIYYDIFVCCLRLIMGNCRDHFLCFYEYCFVQAFVTTKNIDVDGFPFPITHVDQQYLPQEILF